MEETAIEVKVSRSPKRTTVVSAEVGLMVAAIKAPVETVVPIGMDLVEPTEETLALRRSKVEAPPQAIQGHVTAGHLQVEPKATGLLAAINLPKSAFDSDDDPQTRAFRQRSSDNAPQTRPLRQGPSIGVNDFDEIFGQPDLEPSANPVLIHIGPSHGIR